MSSDTPDQPTADQPKAVSTDGDTSSTLSGLQTLDRVLGSVVGNKYKVVEKIGEGAMGAVYKAEHTWMDRVVALKVLHPHLLTNESLIKRFQNEARTASKITHPNAVTLFDFGIDGNVPYIAMRFAAGTTLKQILKTDSPLPLERIELILAQIGGALAEAHQLGIVHRDLKPDNVMVSTSATGEDWAEVLDFGIAKSIGSMNSEGESTAVTQTGMVIGTPQYMSPEQAAGKSVDARSDQYALGVIAYEMLCGRVPFPGGTLMEVLMAHIGEKPTPLRKVNRDLNIPRELERVVMRTLEKDVDRRYSSVKDFVEAFSTAVKEVERNRSASSKKKLALGAMVALCSTAGVTWYVAGGKSAVGPTPSGEEDLVKSDAGFLKVVSVPDGADVFVEGDFRGQTPLLVQDVVPGQYLVAVKLEGYNDRSIKLEVSPGETTGVKFPLKPLQQLAAVVPPTEAAERPGSEQSDAAQSDAAQPDQLAMLDPGAEARLREARELEAAALEQMAERVDPTPVPTAIPTPLPTAVVPPVVATPAPQPTVEPTIAPTAAQTPLPTAPLPTAVAPTAVPTTQPTAAPTLQATAVPTAKPTATPVVQATAAPTAVPEVAEEPAEEAIVIVQKRTNKFEASALGDEGKINIAAMPKPAPSVAPKPTAPPAPEKVPVPEDLYTEVITLVKQQKASAAAAKLAQIQSKQPTAVTGVLGRLRQKPSDPDARYALAVVFSVLNQKDRAIRELQGAIAIDPKFRTRAQNDPVFARFKTDPAFGKL